MGAAANIVCRRAALTAFAALALNACEVTPGPGRLGGWDFAVRNPSTEWGSFLPDRVYEVQRDVLLVDFPERTNGPALAAGAEWTLPPGTFRAPATVAEFEADPKPWRGVAGVVTSGTRVRAEALRGKGNLRDKEITVNYVRGRIMDGPFQGRLVDLQALSLYAAVPDSRQLLLRGPNEDFLALAP